MTSILGPVDPATVTVAYLKERTGLLLDLAERGGIPDLPVPHGWYRCFTCRREFEKGQTDAEAEAEYERRFGTAPGPLHTVCDDCNRIIAEDQGLPLLCPLGLSFRPAFPARDRSPRLPRNQDRNTRTPCPCPGRTEHRRRGQGAEIPQEAAVKLTRNEHTTQKESPAHPCP